MLKYLLICFFTLFINHSKAQKFNDLIVSKSKDTIRCSIQQITGEGISFSTDQIPKGYLNNTQIASFKYGFYAAKSDGKYRVEGIESDTIYLHPSARILLMPSWVYMPGNISYSKGSDLSKYYNNLRNGIGINVNYERYNHWGQGLYVSGGFSHTSNHLDKILFPVNDTQSLSGPLSDRINMSYLSFGYSGIDALDSMNTIRGYAGIGVMFWNNKGEVITDFNMWAWLPILHAGFGYDRRINQKYSVQADISYSGGLIRRYTVKDENGKRDVKLNNKTDIDASRICLSIGIIKRIW